MPAELLFDTDHLVVGECVADVVQPLAGPSVTHPGGSPANVAVGLARLGESVTLLTELGADDHGVLIRRHLDASGVTVRAADSGRAQPTPSAIARLDEHGAATYDFRIAWALDVVAPPVRARHVHAGSIGAVLPPGADAVVRLMAAARSHSSTSLDPNVRPALLRDREAARSRIERLAALSDVVKASDEDLAWLYPGEDLGSVARRWTDRGAALVVVTRGDAGALAWTGGGAMSVDPVPTRVADTVGAGDSFMSALLYNLHRSGLLGAQQRAALRAAGSEQLRQVLRSAARAAAITVSRAGANPPTLDELLAAEAGVEV